MTYEPGSCLSLVIRQFRALDKVCYFISIMPISSANPIVYHMLESSHRDDANKWSNKGFAEEMKQVELIEVHFTLLI